MQYIIFARHGECEDQPPYGLNENGRNQIKQLGEAILSYVPDVLWSLISSPLQRARESSEILANIVSNTGGIGIEECLKDGFVRNRQEVKERENLKLRYVKDVIKEHGQKETSLILITHELVFSCRYMSEHSRILIGQETYLGIPNRGQAYLYDLEKKTVHIIPQR